MFVIGVVVFLEVFVDFVFVWKVCCYVKFNVILFVKDGVLVGVGMGQVNWVDFCWFVVEWVGEWVVGLVVVLDVFFCLRMVCRCLLMVV